MDLQAEKLNILQTIMATDDEGLIMDVKAILSGRESDWFDELGDDQQKDILEGISMTEFNRSLLHLIKTPTPKKEELPIPDKEK